MLGATRPVRGAVDLGQKGDDPQNRRLGNPIEYRRTLPPGGDEGLLAQFREMLGQSRLRQTEQGHHLTDGHLAIPQLAQDHQALLVGEGAKQPCRFAGAGFKAGNIKVFQFDHCGLIFVFAK